ncbi:phage tail tape measure protein [Terrisporobacter mayombei]|uniref:Phage tail tape measure protein domain-containing protein n=1 Tax=Terrisporobacter mayombei TaxID=1541 RepID=A0ABY9Q055_9FIRM|nr:phage tail tape measure protein [Terrisporobacter mayombei]MCC3868514.1 phage tail tape measure protein [Terrisporobacter mayombei]WMT80670.1 hypothetical protein TEMA_09910 [Terrisporobacter mayombei]
MAADIGSIVAHLRLEMGEFTNNLNVAQQQVASTADSFNGITSAGKALQGVGAGLTAGITVPVMALGKQAIELGSNFSSAMSKVKGLSGATEEEFKQLSETAREMGASTIYSATDAADALGYMALAGWDAKQSMDAIPGVLNLAASSGMDLAMASDMVTDYLSAFGEGADQAGRMADVLAYAQANSNTTTEQLGDAFKNCAANANAFGLDIEQTAALLGKLSDQGLKGSLAGTALTATFRDITQKMEKGAITIGKTKISVQDANGNFRSMTDILTDVASATDGMGNAQKSAALMGTFTADSIKALNILLQSGSGNIKDFEAALRNADGTAEEMADTMNDNLKGDMAELESAFEEACLTIYDKLEPALRLIVQAVTNLVNWFSNLPAPVMGFIMALAGILAVVGPILLIIGTFMSKIVAIREGIAMLKALNIVGTLIDPIKTGLLTLKTLILDSLIPALSSLWAFLLANPIVLVVAAIAALVAGFIYLWNNCEGFREFWINLWDTICQWAQDKWNELVNFFMVTMPEWFNSVIQWFQQLPGQIWYWLMFAINYVLLWIEQMGQNAWKAGCDFVQNLIQWFQTLPERLWRWFLMTVNNAIQWKNNMVAKAQETGKAFLDKFINWIKGLPGRIWDWLVKTFNKVVKWAQDMDKKADKTAKDFCKGIIDGIKNLPNEMLEMGKNICQGLADGIKGGIKWVTDAAKSIAKKAADDARAALGIRSPSRVFRDEIGKFIPEGMAIGIESNADSVYKTLRNLSDNLASNINVSGLMDSINIRTSDINVNSKNSNAGLIAEIKGLIEAVNSNSAIDYGEMERAFMRGAERVDSTIYMDKTIIGQKTAEPVRQTNDAVRKRLNRLEGVLE